MVAHAQNGATAYLNLRRAAEYVGLDERTLRNYIAAGQLTAYRLGPRQIQIKIIDLEALLRPIPAGDAA